MPDQEVIATSLSIFICTKYGHLPGVVGFGSGQYGLVFITNSISQNMQRNGKRLKYKKSLGFEIKINL